MQLTFLKIPNKILMNIDPSLNKNEYLVCLLFINVFMADFNRDKLEITIRPTAITKNEIATQTIKYHSNIIIGNLAGRKIICDSNKSPTVVLFETIEKTKAGYEIKISPTVREIFETGGSFSLIYLDILNKLKTYKCIKFYCLMKIWGDEFDCYIKWLRWYLNIQYLDTAQFFKLYINKFIKELKQMEILIKMAKHKDDKDNRLIQKLTFDVFDSSERGNL
jgi:hypothetical protein